MCAPAESSTPIGTHPDGARASPELGDLLRRHGERYTATHRVSSIQHKVIRALSQCRTAALGGHLEACDRCGDGRAVYHSCRNRHCPKCQALAQADWLEARRADLLPVEYFHVVFTLPHELCPLALYRPRIVYDLLFRAATATLATFAQDPRHFSGKTSREMGGTLGITAILHTWAQNLSLHPRALRRHGKLCLRISRASSRRATRVSCFPCGLYPRCFAENFSKGSDVPSSLESSATTAPFPDSATHFGASIGSSTRSPRSQGRKACSRTSADTHRIAISNPRILGLEKQRVAFRYRDSTDASKQGSCTSMSWSSFAASCSTSYPKASCGSVTMDCSLIGLGRKRSRAVVSYSRPPSPSPGRSKRNP